MPTSTFAQPANNFLAVLAADHAIADDALALTWGVGVPPLGAPAAGRVYRLTAWTNYGTSSQVPIAIVEATAIGTSTPTGATLAGLAFVEGYSDRALGAGTVLTDEMTAGDLAEVQDAVNALEAGFVFVQSAPASTWDITHDRGCYPAPMVMDSAGDRCWGQVRWLSLDRLTITFGAPFSGTATLR